MRETNINWQSIPNYKNESMSVLSPQEIDVLLKPINENYDYDYEEKEIISIFDQNEYPVLNQDNIDNLLNDVNKDFIKQDTENINNVYNIITFIKNVFNKYNSIVSLIFHDTEFIIKIEDKYKEIEVQYIINTITKKIQIKFVKTPLFCSDFLSSLLDIEKLIINNIELLIGE